MKTSRRGFIRTLAAAGAAAPFNPAWAAESPAARYAFGICETPGKAAALKEAGFSFLEGGVEATLQPKLPDAAFAPRREALRACPLPLRACNCFFSAEFRLTGPEAAHGLALAYAEVACRRADEIGMPFIVLGSGSARRVPDGWPLEKGREQFIAFCRQLGERISGRRVTIVLEPLYKRGSNLLNTVAEGIGYVDEINHPRIRLLADFYHMLCEEEGPESIRKAGARLRHCHLAEKESHTAPGMKGEDFSGYFRALRDIGYDGGVSCECGWPKQNVEAAWRKAVAVMRQQSGM
ncbi:MAG: sugar phosphate isomerase/epimerase family protein [Kiritimatiellia bacterium]|jgi:sugar phosphate isomerase/epimerase|nr:sugar phosphate isomerase/epimerase family protein [Kiritimatiellia bacterium]